MAVTFKGVILLWRDKHLLLSYCASFLKNIEKGTGKDKSAGKKRQKNKNAIVCLQLTSPSSSPSFVPAIQDMFV